MALFSKHAVGIDISDSSIEMLELKESGSTLQVVAYRRLELPDGIVENGRIVDQQKLTSQLIAAASLPGYGHFRTKAAVVSLPESQTYIHLFRLPAIISAGQLGEAIQYEAEETLPLFWDQTRHDYQMVRKDAGNQDVLYVACSKEIIAAYQQVIGEAGFELEALEPESAALARALVDVQAAEPALIADIGARTTILTVYDQQAIHFSENVPIAGRHISDAVAQKLSLPPAEAEASMKKSGLTSLPTAQAIEPLLLGIIEAIHKVIRMYQKNSGRAVSQIIVCGGTSMMPGLVQYFSNQLHVQTRAGNPLAGLAHNDKVFTGQSPILYSTVIGLAKRGLNDKALAYGINLLNDAKAPHGKKTAIERRPVPVPVPKPHAGSAASGWAVRNKRSLALLAVFGVLVIGFVVLYMIKMRPLG